MFSSIVNLYAASLAMVGKDGTSILGASLVRCLRSVSGALAGGGGSTSEQSLSPDVPDESEGSSGGSGLCAFLVFLSLL